MTAFHQTVRRRELAVRSAPGVDVALTWEPDTDDLVVVCRMPRGRVIEVRPRAEDAMLAFTHPFAYDALTHG
jgi:hypothetical protein